VSADIVIKGVDAIFKLIPFLKSWTGARRREYFEKAIVPLHDEVGEVHDFYNELFLGASKKMLDIEVGSISLVGLKPELTLDDFTAIEAAKGDFLKLRMTDEGLRDILRQEAQDMFARIKWKEERRFLASTVYYFLGEGGNDLDDVMIDEDVERVIEEGGVRRWDTPSMRLYLDIRDSRDPVKIREMLDEARNRLNQRYMNVRRHFRRVQHQIIMTT
jgi:hypothetical protein